MHHRKTIWKNIGWIGLLTVIVLSAASAGAGQALQKGEWYLPESYPDGFHGWGHIDRIGSREIVIDDGLFPLSKSVSYHTPRASNVPVSWFKPGDLVGFLTNAEEEIVSIWRFE